MAQVDGMLERIASLAKELRLANLEPQIAACRRQCNGRQGIDVAVFGRFKAGKSSFLNSLTGRAVLPIGVVPLTAVITRLRFGPTEKAEVRFLNGTAKAVPVGDIGGYVCEDANPGNEKEVAAVEVELPALKALAPLEFVDTPGLGSAFMHNTEAAMRWLPNVGAALVAVSCDAPLSERDLGLLEELRRHTPSIVLQPTQGAMQRRVTGALREELGRWRLRLPRLVAAWREWLNGFLRGELTEVSRSEQAMEGRVERIARELELPRSRNSTLRKHLASLQLLSIDLYATLPSSGLRGYGEVAPATARYLEEEIPGLEELVTEIVRVLARGK